MEDSFSSSILPEARSRIIKPVLCCQTRHETFFRYYTLWLIISDLLNMLYYVILISNGNFGPRHISFLNNVIDLTLLFLMVRAYYKNYDYGLDIHYCFAAYLYYFTLFLYIGFLIGGSIILTYKIEYVLDHPFIGGNKGYMYTLLIGIFFILLPHATFDLYLKYLYFKVIKLKREENRVKGEAELVCTRQDDSSDQMERKTNDSGLI